MSQCPHHALLIVDVKPITSIIYLLEGIQKFKYTICRPYSSSEKWRPSDKDHHKKLRNTCSLNCSCHEYGKNDYLLDHSTTIEDEEGGSNYCLSRQNGIRHSTRHHLHHRPHPNRNTTTTSSESNYSISSESSHVSHSVVTCKTTSSIFHFALQAKSLVYRVKWIHHLEAQN